MIFILQVRNADIKEEADRQLEKHEIEKSDKGIREVVCVATGPPDLFLALLWVKMADYKILELAKEPKNGEHEQNVKNYDEIRLLKQGVAILLEPGIVSALIALITVIFNAAIFISETKAL